MSTPRSARELGAHQKIGQVKISEELDHIHGRFFLGNYHDTYHGPHTKENPETIFDDDLKEIEKGEYGP